MNQYRCETCKYTHDGSNCPAIQMFIGNMREERIIREITSKIGCASHSDFQSERDMVLDTDSVLAVLKKRYHNEMAILDYIEMIECEVMALRQAGEP